MKKHFILIGFLMLIFKISNAQELDQMRKDNARSFIKDLFVTSKSNEFIISKYIFIHSTKIAEQEKEKLFVSNLLDALKNKNSKTFTRDNFSVTEYKDYKGAKASFTKSDNDVYLILVNNVPKIYCWFNEKKIASFTTIMKDKESYFVTY